MTAESIVSFSSRLSVALSSPQRVHSTSAWQSFLLCFMVQFRLMIFHEKEIGEGTDMKTLAFILQLLLNLVSPHPWSLFLFSSMSLQAKVYIWRDPTWQHWIKCPCQIWMWPATMKAGEDSFISGYPISSWLVRTYRAEPWPTALDAPSLASSSCCRSTKAECSQSHLPSISFLVPCPPLPGPHPAIHPWGSGTKVYFTTEGTSQKHSTALEIPYVLERNSIAQPPSKSVWTGT